MEVLTTGIPTLDDAIGGGLLEDSNLLIVYDTYSYGWTLAFEVLRNRMKLGDFGVVLDSVMPLSHLKMELNVINFDVEKEGKGGNLAIMDVFSSFYGITYPGLDFVYTDTSIDSSTFLPKYTGMYRRILSERILDRRPIGIDSTIDGLAFLLGEEAFVRVFQNIIALKEKARVTENRKRPLNILLLNRGRASESLMAWISLYSQYVIEFSSSSSGVERMFIRKSPLPDFAPKAEGYSFSIRKGRIKLEAP